MHFLTSVRGTLPFFLLGLILPLFRVNVTGNDYGTQFTPDERVALDKFHTIVDGMIIQDFMRDDAYLINWLRANKLDVFTAVEKFRNTLKWRKENDIDNILKEEFSDGFTEFPFYIDGIDYKGRPVYTTPIGKYNIRRAALLGPTGAQVGLRRARYANEKLQHRILELNSRSNGTMISQGLSIQNMDGFNMRQHACLQCIGLYATVVSEFYTHYPYFVNKTIVIKAPRALATLVNILTPLIPSAAITTTQMFGHNKAEWQDAVLKLVPASEIRPQFGGTKRD